MKVTEPPPPRQPLYNAKSLESYFPALYLLAVVLKFFAWLSPAIVAILAFVLLVPAHHKGPEEFFISVIFGVPSSLPIVLLLWAMSDFIKLMLCLERNTRHTAEQRRLST